jgi:peroxiredoxin
MRIFRIIILLFLFLSGYSIFAQTVKINGSGKGYANTELRFFSQTDPISKNLMPLFRLTCDEKGSFSCLVPCRGTGIINIKTGLYCFNLQINEGSEYTLRLPDFAPKPAGQEYNPYFAETRLIPDVVNDTNNINNLIRIFDGEYNPVFNLVADLISKNYKRNEIPSIIEKLNNISGSMSPTFNSGFIKFRLIMLNMVAYGMYPGRKEDSVMINQAFIPDNQAYTDLIEQIFSGSFRRFLTGTGKDNYIRAIGESSLPELRSLVLSDGKAVNSQLRDYVILMNLYNEYWSGSIPLENTLLLMTALKEDASSAFISETASMMILQIPAMLSGRIPPDFSLAGTDGKALSLKDFKGKYLLLCFARSDNPSVMEEFSILKMWQNKYPKELAIVTILVDRDFKTASGKMKKYGFGWNFLDGSDADLLEYQYNIKIHPSFILLDTEGKIVANPAPYPSENLEWLVAKKIGKE